MKLFRNRRYAYEHTERIFKLYSVFCKLSKDKVTGNFKDTFLCIQELFGYSLLSSHHYDDQEYLNKIVLFAKKKLAEMDLHKISQSHVLVLNKLRDIVQGYVEAWPDQDQYTLNFLWETVPAMLTGSSPLLTTMDEIIEEFRKALITEDFQSLEDYGLMKYFISKKVFSMKRSESLVLAQSALTKLLISSVKDTSSESFILMAHPRLEGNSIIYL